MRLHLAWLFGAALGISGIVADAAVGLAILRGASPWILLLHPPAVLLWSAGVSMARNGTLWHEVRALLADRRRRGRTQQMDGTRDSGGQRGWNVRTIVLTLLALVLFPGFGPIGCTAAFGLTALPFMIRHQRAAPPTDPDSDKGTVHGEEPANPLFDLSIEPLVDVVHTPDARYRRAAIRLLGQQFDQEAVRLLRHLLTDPDPDVRSEASVTLFRFENLLARSVNEAAVRVRENPGAEEHAALAEAYCRVVQIGLLDEPSARYSLSQACQEYKHATALAPEHMVYWVALAKVQRDLGESAAVDVLNEVLSREPGNVAAICLGMEIALAERRWDLLERLSQQEYDPPYDQSSTRELLRWWSGGSTGEAPVLRDAIDRVGGRNIEGSV